MPYIETPAGLHAWAGDDAVLTVHFAGRLFFIALGAAMLSDIGADDLDVRILRSSVNALSALESHRSAIKAGLTSIDRLLPRCSDYSVAQAAINLDYALKTSTGYPSIKKRPKASNCSLYRVPTALQCMASILRARHTRFTRIGHQSRRLPVMMMLVLILSIW